MAQVQVYRDLAGRFDPDLCVLHVDVSLDKILNPKLLPIVGMRVHVWTTAAPNEQVALCKLVAATSLCVCLSMDK